MPRVVHIEHPELATEDVAREQLARIFPRAGAYYVKSPARLLPFQTTFSAPPAQAGSALVVWQRVFPAAGDYLIGDTPGEIMKATVKTSPVESHVFQEWWLERLTQDAAEHVGSIRDLVWRRMLDFVEQHAGHLTTPEVLDDLERLLFDLRTGVRWAVATPVSAATEARLRLLGFTDRDVLDFPGIAYRMGMLEETIAQKAPAPHTMPWDAILDLVKSVPLTPAAEAGIAVARQRAGQFLTPITLRDGTAVELAAAQREAQLVRRLTRDAVRRELHPRELARQLYKRIDEEGMVRDVDRVARTEIAEARNRGAFEADQAARGWEDATLLWRPLAAVPCNACLTLYRNADGTPRLWKRGELEALDAEGPNRGPWRGWRPKIGPTHPNCVCGPWQTYQPALRSVYERQAPQWATMMRERKLAEGAA